MKLFFTYILYSYIVFYLLAIVIFTLREIYLLIFTDYTLSDEYIYTKSYPENSNNKEYIYYPEDNSYLKN